MGSARYLGIIPEVTAGTDPGSGYKFMPVDSETLEPKPITHMFTRSMFSQPTVAHGYGIPTTGDITLKAPRASDLLFFIQGFWGMETYSFALNNPTSGINRHQWTDFSNQPLDNSINQGLASPQKNQCTQSIHIGYDQIEMGYVGCWFNSWVLTQEIGMPLESTFGVISSIATPTRTLQAGGSNIHSPTLTNTTKGFGNYDPSIVTTDGFNGSFDLRLGGSSIRSVVKKFELRIERNYDPNLFTSDSLFTKSFQTPGPTKITGTITIDKTDAVTGTPLITRLLNRTETELEAIWIGDNISGSYYERLDLDFNKAILTGGIAHLRSQRTPPGYESAFTFELYRSGGTTPQLQINSVDATL